MNTNYLENNYLTLVGKVTGEKKFSHEIYGESFYVFNLEIPRLSGNSDIIPITVSERLIKEDRLNISYDIVKIDFSNPNNQKRKVIDLMKQGNMAIIHVGPSEISPLTFSKNGHYLVISDIDSDNNFYVINSNEIGDNQLGVPFDYDTIIKNMTGRKDSFNFLFIKKLDK